MEYRRRRSGRKRQAGRRNNGGGTGMGAVRAFILLLIFGAAAYLLLAAGAGRKLRDIGSFTLPSSCGGKTESPSPLPNETEKVNSPLPETAAPTAAPTGETASVKLPGIDIYMLQLGVYNSFEECEKAAESIKKRGAAGYVYEDNGVYRLIAAAYSDEASAASVKERLTGEGISCAVIRLSYTGAELLITAHVERLTPIRTAFAFAYEIVSELEETALDFDENGRSIDYALGVLKEIERNANSARSGITDPAIVNSVLERLSSYYTDIEEAAKMFSSGLGDRAECSSALKYLRIYAALSYAKLLSEIGE